MVLVAATMQVLLLMSLLVIPCYAWVSPSGSLLSTLNHPGSSSPRITTTITTTTTRLHLGLNPLLAGSIAGAVGVGIAFPLDTIKTKQQAAAAATSAMSLVDHSDIDFNADGTIIIKRPTHQQQQRPSLYQSMLTIVENQGISGLFSGVGTTMMGQAIIKSVAFGVNSAVLSYLTQQQHSNVSGEAVAIIDPNNALLLAAATAGFVTAFLATPIDRIKVLRQCNSSGGEACHLTDMDCLKSVLLHEGLQGLMFRGLGPTLLREVPAYTIYFCTFGWLHSTFGDDFVPAGASTLLYGALAGGLCVLPSYPAVVIKTLVQNSNGSNNKDNEANIWTIVQEMYETRGMAGFWDGLSPRMLRAAINHAVTFATYNALI